jgi:hypothetical protein
MNQTPCQTGDPEDWFIEKDGKQYPDDKLVDPDALTKEQYAFIDLRFDQLVAEDLTLEEAGVKVRDELEEGVKVQALVRRRHAKDACFVECKVRLQCLSSGLEVPYGIFGGYTLEERREIVRLRDERAAKRHQPEE